MTDNELTDEQIIKALECCVNNNCTYDCPFYHDSCIKCKYSSSEIIKFAFDLINRQKAENEKQRYILMGVMHSVDKWLEGDELKQDETNRAITMREKTLQIVEGKQKEIEGLKAEIRNTDNILNSLDRPLVEVKSEAIKEFAEKITEVFMRYAHLHSYAEGARKDYIEATDGTEIEMQSVWDVFNLQKDGMAEYEEMNRLQSNIETIEKERLLTELEKDFRLLVKEMGCE